MSFVHRLISVFNFGAAERLDRDLKRWAQIEYPKDWVWAYNFMLENPGVVPHVRGVVL